MSCCSGTSSSSCCGGPAGTQDEQKKTIESVKEYYGKVLSTSKDLKTSACTASGRPPQYIINALKTVPEEIIAKFYGCGSPIPSELEGLTTLDLGCGAGRDMYVAARLVGPKGRVIGVDMTDEQLTVARKYTDEYCKKTLGYPADIFDIKKGYIERLDLAGIPENSVDLVMSNCVINLSPDKESVIAGAYRVLKQGGELYFSDVYCDRRMPKEAQQNEVLWGECISGALYIEDFKRIARKVGFTDPRVLKKSPIVIRDPELQKILGEAKFFSILFRCFKLDNLETLCEDYGQVAVYNGGIVGSEHGYDLDDHHHFTKGKPMLVCGNTAAMVQDTRLGRFFTVTGNRSVHFGLFPCGPAPAAPSDGSADAAAADCCSGGGCC